MSVAVGAAQIPASHAELPQGGAVSMRNLRVSYGLATADAQRVKPKHEGTGPTPKTKGQTGV